jgi:hypothetical protein
LAGTRHGRFLRDVLYVYNEGNQISDAKIRPADCARAHATVKRRPPKEPLP